MKLNNKILAIIFFFLLGIWIINSIISKPKTRSFKATLIQVDTSQVDWIVMYPKGIDSTRIELTSTGSGWNATDGTLTVEAASSRVNSILGQLVNIPTQRLISKSPDKFADYEVDDKTGKLVELYSNGNLIHKIIFGRFNFNPNTRSATSYARIHEENDIYSIDGFMSMSFDTDFNSFRDKSLLNISTSDVKGLEYISNRGTITLAIDQQGQWIANGALSIDSTAMASYLNGISNLSGRDFDDNFNPSSPATHSLKITADNVIGNLQVDCFERNGDFVIKSADNQAFFKSDSSGIYKQLFTELSSIIPE